VSESRSEAAFWIFFAASALFGWHALVDTLRLSLLDDEYTYILLIFPVSAVLLYLIWPTLRSLLARSSRVGPALLLLAGGTACCAWFWSRALSPDVRLSAEMFALVLWWVGDFVFWFGARATRLALFPLCFLLGLVPPPRFALDAIIYQLQLGSAWAAHALFWMARMPADQSGVSITIPGLTIQVAQECSSIRSSSMLLVTTLVLAHLFLHSRWRRLFVIAAAIPFSVAKNGLRIWVIATLGTEVDSGYLTGRLHRQGGIIFFAAALLGVFALLWLLKRGEDSIHAGAGALPLESQN
jgi:exosortase